MKGAPTNQPLVNLMVIIGATTALVSLFVAMIRQWPGPMEPLYWCLGAVVLVLSGVFLGRMGQASRGRSRSLWPGIAVTIILLVVTLAWTQERVRLVLLDLAVSDEDRGVLMAATDDPMLAVRVAACRRLLESWEPDERMAMVRRLLETPDLASLCLTTTTNRGVAADLADSLVERWFFEVDRYSPLEANETCELMRQVSDLASVTPSSPVALLSCALRGANHDLRACCAGELALAAGSGDEIARAVSHVSRGLHAAVPALVEASFLSGTLEGRARDVAVNLALDAPAVRRLALTAACELAEEPEMPAAVMDHLSAIVDDPSCDVAADSMRGRHNGWQAVCFVMEEELFSSLEADRVLCEATREFLIGDSMQRASASIHASTSRAAGRARRDAIRSTSPDSQPLLELIEQGFKQANKDHSEGESPLEPFLAGLTDGAGGLEELKAALFGGSSKSATEEERRTLIQDHILGKADRE